jgi:hypothetical protein
MFSFSCLSFNATIETNVEGIKVCHIAGRSIGKAWQLRKGKNLETRYVERLLVVYVYVSLLSLTGA